MWISSSLSPLALFSCIMLYSIILQVANPRICMNFQLGSKSNFIQNQNWEIFTNLNWVQVGIVFWRSLLITALLAPSALLLFSQLIVVHQDHLCYHCYLDLCTDHLVSRWWPLLFGPPLPYLVINYPIHPKI